MGISFPRATLRHRSLLLDRFLIHVNDSINHKSIKAGGFNRLRAAKRTKEQSFDLEEVSECPTQVDTCFNLIDLLPFGFMSTFAQDTTIHYCPEVDEFMFVTWTSSHSNLSFFVVCKSAKQVNRQSRRRGEEK